MSEEQHAHDFYLVASEQVFDRDLKRFLTELASMEREHCGTLKKKLEEYKANRFLHEGDCVIL